MQQLPSDATPKASKLFALVGGTAVLLFIIGLTGLPNLMDNERRVGAYVLDAVHNGHWLAQRESTGEVMSKPPMVTWIASLPTLVLDRPTRFAIYLPSALATTLAALLILQVGGKRFGWTAGLLGAFAYLLSYMGDKLMQTTRYDGLFALPVALAALAAFRAWETGRGWTWFWLAAAFATLVKGPLGVVLGASGLLAGLWEWRSGARQPLRGQHWLGLALFAVLCGGWFWLAYREMGQPLIDKLINRELVRHAVKGTEGEGIGVKFWEPPLAFLTNMLPWSIASVIGFWRVLKHPSPDVPTRRFERFLFCWFAVGLVIFCAAAHQRSRLVFPLMPAAALLAGRELARLLAAWKPHWQPQTIVRAAAGVAAFVIAFQAVYHYVLLRKSDSVQRTLAVQEFASKIQDDVGAQFPLSYVDSPFAIQFYLNTMRRQVPPERAAELLKGEVAAFVVIGDTNKYQRIRELVGTNGPLHELRYVSAGRGKYPFWLVSNHPRLEWTERTASLDGSLRVETRQARPIKTRGGEMRFQRLSENGAATFSNEDSEPLSVRLRLSGHGPELAEQRLLQPGESWRIGAAGSAAFLPSP
jgi:4-amino-4-deoxy-L-arabinose transferase-like glycosyltransferase